MVTWTRLCVKLYVHYPSYFKCKTVPGNKVRAEAVLCYSSIWGDQMIRLAGWVKEWTFYLRRQSSTAGRVRLKPDGTRRRTGGEVKRKLANGVGSQYSHTTSERGVSSITTADGHISAASSRLNWRPRWFKWTRPYRRKAKSGFCACVITFQTQSKLSYVIVNVTEVIWKLFYIDALADFVVCKCIMILTDYNTRNIGIT
jgi:hypothetical protein